MLTILKQLQAPGPGSDGSRGHDSNSNDGSGSGGERRGAGMAYTRCGDEDSSVHRTATISPMSVELVEVSLDHTAPQDSTANPKCGGTASIGVTAVAESYTLDYIVVTVRYSVLSEVLVTLSCAAQFLTRASLSGCIHNSYRSRSASSCCR